MGERGATSMASDAPAGQPAVARSVVEQAVHWFVRLSSGLADDADRAAARRWRDADPQHERAWQRLEGMGQVLQRGAATMPAAVARDTLRRVADPLSRSRRAAFKAFAWAGVAGTTAWLFGETGAGQVLVGQALADHRTGVGERRSLHLADGTKVMLNTATSIDVAFDASQRRLRLIAGEIEVITAADPARRPFVVATEDGLLLPVGTRFTVRRMACDTATLLTVSAGAVALLPAGDAALQRLVGAGWQARFDRHHAEVPQPLADDSTAWTDGLITAERLRLGDFIAELDRYRPGHLRCDPAVADLLITGAWPLDGPRSTDRILANLERTLPVRVTAFTRYWATVGPR